MCGSTEQTEAFEPYPLRAGDLVPGNIYEADDYTGYFMATDEGTIVNINDGTQYGAAGTYFAALSDFEFTLENSPEK